MNKKEFLRLLEPCTIHDYPALVRKDEQVNRLGSYWGQIILYPKASMDNPISIGATFVSNYNAGEHRLQSLWQQYNRWLLEWYKTMTPGMIVDWAAFTTHQLQNAPPMEFFENMRENGDG